MVAQAVWVVPGELAAGEAEVESAARPALLKSAVVARVAQAESVAMAARAAAARVADPLRCMSLLG